MEISFATFLQGITTSPALLVTTLLTLGVIFVNGWTDAPNAIATCVTTRCMSTRAAIWMSALFNFLGVFIMTQINSSVASTISNMVDFGGNTREALIALCAALFSIVVYSVGASYFGIPTSESHSLIAGLTGAAIAIQNGVGGINMDEWAKVLYGLVMSLLLGFAIGFVICKLVGLVCGRMDRRKTNTFFKGAQIFGAAAMSFMHGAQDGQKFIGHQRRRRKDHQVGRHGHGQARKVPGLLGRPRGSLLPPAFQPLRHPGLDHPHQDQRHHGCRRRPPAVGHQPRGRQGDDAHLDLHLPGLRPHQLPDGQTLHRDLLNHHFNGLREKSMSKKQDSYYFQNFIDCADYACQAARMLKDTVGQFDVSSLSRRLDEIHEIEHAADQKKHELLNVLVKAFITPIEREDILQVSNNLDDMTDKIEDVVIKLYYNRVTAVRPDVPRFVDMLIRCCEEVRALMNDFADFKRSKTLHDHIIRINTLEEEADKLFIDAMYTLHDSCKDPLEVITWREIYLYLEKCVDTCEHVADVVESVVMKNS